MVYITVKMGPKGQVVIPKPIRDDFGMEPSDEMVVGEEIIHGKKKVVVEKKANKMEGFLEFLDKFRRKHAIKHYKFDADRSYDEQMEARLGHILKKKAGRR